MIDVYKAWIRDFGVDGFRIDTMKHVDDAFWQAFGPEVLRYARARGKREFFMFGEVFDTTKSFTSHFTTQDDVQAVIDFPFQAAAENFAARSTATNQLRDFFAGDDWYTDADSNVYQLPTFLGNHDMGRIGFFVSRANPGAADAELVARDRLAHQLMYLSRGNPVIYYGDEQGFTGTAPGNDQLARQDMFASRTEEYWDDDLLGTDRTHRQANFNPDHPLYRAIGELARLTQRHDALRDGAQIHRLSSSGAGIYAISRLDRKHPHEYVVALNNSESVQSASVPTYMERGWFERVYGSAVELRRQPARDRAGAVGRRLPRREARAAQPARA
jgi:glycosidase